MASGVKYYCRQQNIWGTIEAYICHLIFKGNKRYYYGNLVNRSYQTTKTVGVFPGMVDY